MSKNDSTIKIRTKHNQNGNKMNERQIQMKSQEDCVFDEQPLG